MIDVLVTGAAGKMGLEVLKAVTDAEDMRVCRCGRPEPRRYIHRHRR